jgi:hypothetical protein
MKYRAMTVAILMLAFFLKDAVTLVLATGDMASAEVSASAAPLMLPAFFTVPAGPVGEVESTPLAQMADMGVPDMVPPSAGPPACHAAPSSDSPTPLPEMSNSLQRVTTLGASGAGGLEAILLGRMALGVSALLARQRVSGSRLVGIVPAVAVPPG